MRTLKQLGFIHDVNYALFPQGAILNETDNNDGTPVVREVYGDILSNVYKIVKEAGIDFNNSEDNEDNGYQIYEALKVLFSVKNDTEFILDKNPGSYSIAADLTTFKDKTFIIARASENYDNSINIFKGSGAPTYNFISEDFSANDELLIIIDFSGVRCINLSKSGTSSQSSNTIYYPLQYIDGLDEIWCNSDDNIIFKNLVQIDLTSIITDFEGTPNFSILDIFYHKKNIILLVNVGNNYIKCFYYNTESADFGEFEALGFSFYNAINLDVYSYFFNGDIFCSNNAGYVNEGNKFFRLRLDLDAKTITFIEAFVLDASFQKTTNGIYNNDSILTFNGTDLKNFKFNGVLENFGNLSKFGGMSLFRTKEANKVYFSDGESLFLMML